MQFMKNISPAVSPLSCRACETASSWPHCSIACTGPLAAPAIAPTCPVAWARPLP